MKNLICIVSSWLLLTSAGVQAQQPISQVDPTDSSMWGYLQQQFIPNQPYHFDSRISVNTPLFAEDSTQVPISIDASAIKDINMIMVLADISPFQKVMEIWPGDFEPIFSFNMKVQQATAVRAMVLDKHGHWHVGSGMIDASGGGCAAPSIGLADPAWQDNLGNTTARWFNTPSQQRLKFQTIHPQDTGLANGIPAFFLEDVIISDSDGQQMAKLKLYEPMSENPLLSLEKNGSSKPVELYLRDNNGNEFSKQVLP